MVLPRALGAFFGRERLAIAGVASIELAMVSSFIVLPGVLGVCELGITIFRQTQVQFAAQAGADYALANGFDKTKMSNAIVNATTYAAIAATPAPCQFCGCASATGVTPKTTCGPTATCTVSCPSGFTAGTYVTASSQAQFSPIIPNRWQQPNPVTGMLTLTAQTITRIQ